MRLLNFSNFEFVHGVFPLPTDHLIFRSHDPSSPISRFPLYFGDLEVAEFYQQVSQGRTIKVCMPNKQLNVLDMRYVCAILPILMNPVNKTKDYINILKKLSLTLGLVTFEKQIHILQQYQKPALQPYIDRMTAFKNLQNKPNWVNPLEIQGVRCGITDHDYNVMIFLKELFGHLVDGIIAPAMPSPFHDQVSQDIRTSKIYQELIIFDPQTVLLEVPLADDSTLQVSGTTNLDQYIKNFFIQHLPRRAYTIPMYMVRPTNGGGTGNVEAIRDLKAEKAARNDDKATKELEVWTKKCKKYTKRIHETQVWMQHTCLNAFAMYTPLPKLIKISQ
jgi:hypothetical protein